MRSKSMSFFLKCFIFQAWFSQEKICLAYSLGHVFLLLCVFIEQNTPLLRPISRPLVWPRVTVIFLDDNAFCLVCIHLQSLAEKFSDCTVKRFAYTSEKSEPQRNGFFRSFTSCLPQVILFPKKVFNWN